MVETTEVDGEMMKVVRDDGVIVKCVPISGKQRLVHELNELDGVSANEDVDGIDVWIQDRYRLGSLSPVFEMIHENSFVVRGGNLDREFNGHKNGKVTPGFLYAMPRETVTW